jgi:accessory gene regulator protein AgrB
MEDRSNTKQKNRNEKKKKKMMMMMMMTTTTLMMDEVYRRISPGSGTVVKRTRRR